MRGRPVGTKAEVSRVLTKRQRWTADEWKKVEQAAIVAEETPSDFIRNATLARCKKSR